MRGADVAWPAGLGRGPGLPDPATIDLDGFLHIPGLVYVGTRDTLRDPALRTSCVLDERQGRDRRARAVRWAAMLAEAARAHGLPPPAQLLELPRVAHDFEAAVDAGVVDAAGRWLARTVPALAVPERTAAPIPGETHACRP